MILFLCQNNILRILLLTEDIFLCILCKRKRFPTSVIFLDAIENVFLKESKMVSIKDVARQAGVAISTVSKVLNGYPGVSEDTKK